MDNENNNFSSNLETKMLEEKIARVEHDIKTLEETLKFFRKLYCIKQASSQRVPAMRIAKELGWEINFDNE